MRLFALSLALLLTGCGDAAEDAATASSPVPEAAVPSALSLDGSFVRAAPSGGVSALFVEIRNTTDAADTLVAARSGAAGLVEIHQTRETADGMSEMGRVEGGVAVPAGELVSLEPGGLHIMLMDLQQDLVVGDTLDVEVEFAGQGTMLVRAPIRGLDP